MATKVTGLSAEMREEIRWAVDAAKCYWPNAHLGENTPMQDIASAFRFIRNWLGAGNSIHTSVGALYMDALRHADM